ncbi:MAG: DNA repair protein RecN [Gammaproteobacteria bacterium]
MLIHLHIKNFAIVAELSVEFQSGVTVITGKTGAGKSIIINALALALGKRADSHLIHPEGDRLDISASFDIEHNPAAKEWLNHHELEDELCILRRIISRDGRTRCLVNNQAATLRQVRELSALLVDLHGQHEQQSLMQTNKQRKLLDDYANHKNLSEKVAQIYRQWKKANEQLNQLRSANNNEQHKTLLNYQVQELDELALGSNEIEKLEIEHKQLNQAEDIIAACQQALTHISAEDSNTILTQLQHASHALQTLQDLNPSLKNALDLLNNAQIHCQEAQHELHHYLDHINTDPQRLNEIEQRLQQIYTIARKHHIQPQILAQQHQTLKKELQGLSQSDEQIERLNQDIANFVETYQIAAKKLSASRRKAAEKLQIKVSEKLHQLEIPQGKFNIDFHSIDEPKPYGNENVEFMVCTNPGQPLQALAKIASGGELSRISLAIHVLTSQQDTTPTLLFDEVDVGIGGSTAAIVGQMLRQLGEKTQILCITHLPQVAAHGHHHLLVSKHIADKTTQTQTVHLAHKNKIQEIARMLGGIKVTTQTLKHAEELLSNLN